ncbi:uncharacterized protein Dwil_GK12930 [Drosophila willistoni]|uniref:CHK kinase-like domain-containing protein n=1 Tax=Drosophila willistoni TaxID=7260 RepID=B4NIL8_DROWI|nr:uncharacterized protein LOC6651720 [Drosophila willistoni]EDW84841.2 uncharacterized protein Dwil_GK12930 [Drosophila willistoni]
MTENNNNDQFNADELEAPEWLNSQFITEVLSKYQNETQLEVLDLRISPASAKGDHYASVMFRASVEYKTGKGKFSKSLIVKTMPEQEGAKKDLLGDSHIFKTEIGMYTEVLPKFEKILQEVGDKTKLYVPCIYHSLEPRQVLIFDDLVPLGYTIIRDREPTIEELHSTFSKLAKWHAVSMKIQNEEPEYLKEYKHGLVEMPNFLEHPMLTTGFDNFVQFLKKHPNLAKYTSPFEKIKAVYLEKLADYTSEYRRNRRDDGYYVLCHGDYHLKNMMFKHNKETEELEDCMLVDFQICNLCPIGVDLIYSTYMMLSPEDRLNNWESILNYYFSVLLETLKKIDYKGEFPTLNGFWKQVHLGRYYNLFLLVTLLPMMYAIKSKSLDLIEVIESNEARLKCYQIQEYVDELSKLLPRYESLGYFDNL